MLKRDIAVVLVSVFGLWLATRSAGPSAVRFRKAWHSAAMLDSALVPPEEGEGGEGAADGGSSLLLSDPTSTAARAAAASAALREALSRTQLHAHLPKPVVADLNGDGSLEVLVATHDFGLRLLRPEPPSALSSREGFSPAREVAAASLLPRRRPSSSAETATAAGSGSNTNTNNRNADDASSSGDFDEADWAPAALAVGYLDPPPLALVAAPRKMVAAVVTRGWRVMVFDHNLRMLWSASPARDAARALGEGAALHEVALAVLPSPVRRGDRGLVVVGGSAIRPPAESRLSRGHGIEGLLEAEARREEVEQAHFKGESVVDGGGGGGAEEKERGGGGGGGDAQHQQHKPGLAEAPVDLTRHFSYFAYEGGRGDLRWTHEQTDPLPPGDDRLGGPGKNAADDAAAADDDAGPLTAQHAFRLSAADLSPSQRTRHHPYHSFSYGGGGGSRSLHTGLAADANDPPSCRDFRESALHALPHAWLTTSDTRLEAALFVRHGDGRLLDGPEHEHPEYAYDSWMGGPTPQQRRRAAAGLRLNGGGGGGGGGGGVSGWASRLLFGHGGGGSAASSSSSSSSSLIGNDEAFFSQGAGARAAGSAQGRATVTKDAHAGAAARHGGGAGTASVVGGGGAGGGAGGRAPSQPYRPNALVAHVEGGIEVMHLYSGRPVCRMTLPPGHVVHADLNGDGVVERVAAPPGALLFDGDEGGFAGAGGLLPGHAASSGPCVASATTGAPNRRLLWRLDLCAMRHPTLEGGGAWLEQQEAAGARGHGAGGSGSGSAGGAPAPAAFAAPAFLPLPRAGDGAYSRLRGQHGLVAFFGSDGVVTGVSARGETLFVEHAGCTWGAPWGADGEEDEDEEDEGEGGTMTEEDHLEARLRKEMMGGGDGERGAIDPAHRSFVSTYHDELEREAASERKARRRLRREHTQRAAEAAASAQADGSLYQEPENLDDFAPAVPTLAALALRTGAVPTALLALGARHGVVLSERGSELDRFRLPHPPAQAAVLADFDGDGLTDVIVVTGNGVYGYAQRHASGGLALGSLLAALMVALALVWWGSVAAPLVGGFGGLVVGAGVGGSAGGGEMSGASARAAARAVRRAALKARRSTHWED